MEFKLIAKDRTQAKFSNSKESNIIEQLNFLGVAQVKKSSRYTYFEFNEDIQNTCKMLGLNW